MMGEAQMLKKAAECFGEIHQIALSGAKSNETAFFTEEMKVADQEKAAALLEESGIEILSKIRIADL